jgi:hypothetical protein
MRWIALAIVAMLACTQNPVQAEDAAAQFSTKLFSDACLSNFGHLDKVQAWAVDRHLPPILNPQALAVFVWPRDSGRAWAVRDASGRFVLSIRTDPESCIVWAQTVDAPEVEAAFKKLVDDTRKPGIDVRVDRDKTTEIPNGRVRVQVYRFWSGSPETGFALALAAVNRSGGPFQAMIKTQRVLERDDPIDPGIPLEPPPTK